MQRPGEIEVSNGQKAANISLANAHVRKFKHSKVSAPKPLDRLSNSYERKMKQLKAKAKESGESFGNFQSRVKSEIKSADQIKKDRIMKEKRREKNARPSKKNGRAGGKPNAARRVGRAGAKAGKSKRR